MPSLGRLSVILDLDGRRFSRGASQAQRRMKELKRQFRTAAVGAAAFGAALLAVGRDFVRAASEAENYRVRLKVLLGSVDEGNRMFKEMSKFAGKVPFEYREIMGAATSLSAVLEGGVEDVKRWMPIIADLSASFGMTLQETTSNMIRALSAGIASAEMFRDRGVTEMLGFQAGVSYSAEETGKKIIEEWEKAGSKFRGATDELAETWSGKMSMMKDAWFQFQVAVMESGLLGYLKRMVDTATELIKFISNADQKIARNAQQTYITELEQELAHVRRKKSQRLADFGMGEGYLEMARREAKLFERLTFARRAMGNFNNPYSGGGGGNAPTGGGGGGGNAPTGGGGGGAGRMSVIGAGGRNVQLRGDIYRPGTREFAQFQGQSMAELFARQQRTNIGAGGTQAAKYTGNVARPKDPVAKLTKHEEQFVNFARRLQVSWSSTIHQMINGSMKFGEAMQNMFNQVLQSYLNMVAQMAGRSLFNATGDLFGALPGLSAVDMGGGGGITQIFVDSSTKDQVNQILYEETKFGGF